MSPHWKNSWSAILALYNHMGNIRILLGHKGLKWASGSIAPHRIINILEVIVDDVLDKLYELTCPYDV